MSNTDSEGKETSSLGSNPKEMDDEASPPPTEDKNIDSPLKREVTAVDIVPKREVTALDIVGKDKNVDIKEPPSDREDEGEDTIDAMNMNDSMVKEDSVAMPTANSAVVGDVCRVFGVFFAIGVRVVLLTFCLFTVWLVVDRLDEKLYWLLSITSILLIIETIQIVVTRGGQERKWVAVCVVCYLLACVPSIWILELDRLETYQSKVDNVTTSLTVGVSGLTADIKLDPNLMLSITEQSLLFLIILCRWFLPRGEITRNQLSQLLFVFIGMASDVMELFELFDEAEIRGDRPLTLGILFVWSLSLFQFSLVLTMSRSPKKRRVAFSADSNANAKSNEGIVDALLKSELWSLIVSIMMQDGPFLVVRLYSLVTYNLVNYSIIFFTCKNVLVIMLLFYRLLILLLEKVEESNDDDDEDDNEDDECKTITTTTGSPLPATNKQRRRNQIDPKNSSNA